MKIAITHLPIGKAIAGNRLHFHIGGEQIVASVSAEAGSLVQKHLGRETLAGQTSVVICKTHDHRLDLLPCGQVGQLFKGQHSLQSGFSLAQCMPPRSRDLAAKVLAEPSGNPKSSS